MNEAFEQAKYDWYSHDEWRLADREATYKFFHTAGMERAAEIVDKHATYSYSVGEHRNITDCAAAIRKEAE